MKRITLVLLIVLFLTTVHGLEDLTPIGGSGGYSDPISELPPETQAALIYSQISKEIENVKELQLGIREELKNKPNRAELETFKEEMLELQKQQSRALRGEELIMFLMFAAFFIAVQFLLKAKGWA